MNVLFNIGHPGQVHLFKNVIQMLENRDHRCIITTIDKDVSLNLLDAYGFKYHIVGSAKSSLVSKAVEMMRIENRIYNIAKSFKPDFLVGGVGNVYMAHVGKLLRKPSIIFDDTEHAKIDHLLMDPFADVICTPACYKKDLGKKQICYDGYHELAYLHPNYFEPNPRVLKEIGLGEGEPFIILRFVSWNASHDVGQHGISDKVALVKELEQYGRVLITSECPLESSLEKYKVKVSPEKLHDLLYYATLYIGEGATTASECAVLGTHAIYTNTLRVSTTEEQEQKYNLVFNIHDKENMQETVMKQAIIILENKNAWKDGKQKRKKLLNDKIDVTDFMVRLIGHYPDSVKLYRDNVSVKAMNY